MAKNQFKYLEAIQEIESIVEEIEEGNVSLDQLSDKVKRALSLLKKCKAKLRNTQETVEGALQDLDND